MSALIRSSRVRGAKVRLAAFVLFALPLVLAACNNGGGGGSGY